MKRFELDEACGLLARTPAALDALLRDAPEAWVSANEGDETFSPFDVVGHLIHGERTDWMVRVRVILEHGEARAFEPYDRFAQRVMAKRYADDVGPWRAYLRVVREGGS